MKRILVPCDFSATSIEAIKFANTIAGENRGHITLFHAMELPALYKSSMVLSFEQEFMKDIKINAEDQLKKLAKKWIDKDVKHSVFAEFGGLVPSLKRAADKTQADVLVTGTRGASGVKEYTIGSNAEKIVRNSLIPVITLRKSVAMIKNIVFPTYPDASQEEITMQVKRLQTFFNATLHILFVNTPAIFRPDGVTRPALEKFAKRFMLKNYTTNVYSDTAEDMGIINFSKSIGADMVAMRTHGRKGIAHLAVNSIAEDVINHIECPVWTLKIR